MGRLVIAHHKSYHPYRRDNIEKVRKDEEQAAQEQAVQEGRVLLADSEARIDLLRSKAGLDKPKKKRKPKDDDDINAAMAAPPPVQGHVNFFQDLEMNAAATVARVTKAKESSEADRGVPLAPSAKDLKPWYNTSSRDEKDEPVDYKARAKKDRDVFRKNSHDPLTSITRQLASHQPPRDRNASSSRPTPTDPHAARLTRESSERQRALALIARKKKEKEASAMLTPSTVYEPSEYGDLFNKDDVEAARKERERGGFRHVDVRRHHGWGSDQNYSERRRAW